MRYVRSSLCYEDNIYDNSFSKTRVEDHCSIILFVLFLVCFPVDLFTIENVRVCVAWTLQATDAALMKRDALLENMC